jgi:L-iditol 2-dehydrogenase
MTIPATMRAVVYRGPNDLRVETLPVPRIGPGDLLVKVAACGVCPTDIKKIQYGTVPPPRIFGHETAGTVVRTGSRVSGFKVGDRVALHHHVPCMTCHACRHRAFAQCEQYKRTGITAGFEPAGGGYAEYARVMSFVLPGVVRIPRENSFLEAAMLEPVNTVLKGVRRLNTQPGDTVLVAGQGPIGLMFTRLLTLNGLRVLATDLFEERLRAARRFGARWTWRVPAATDSAKPGPSLDEFVRSATRRRGLDAAVIAVPVDSVVRESMSLVRGGGQVLLFSHTRRGANTSVDLAKICVDEVDLVGSYSADFTLQREVARVVFSRQLDTRALITDVLPLEKTSAAVDLAAKPRPESLKVLVANNVSFSASTTKRNGR